jgi:hypothetical protein
VKADLKKALKELFAPKAGEFSSVTVPPLNYLMVDGHGNPNTSADYVAAIEALYAVSYTLKFFSKKELDRDYVVPPLEGLWWAEDPDAFRSHQKDDWDWTMMIMVPEWLAADQVRNGIDAAQAKKPGLDLAGLRFESLEEGPCVQIMHVGSYDDETPTLLRLHDEYLPQAGLKERGKHHEIYLSDPRKTDPAKLRTVLRQPVTRIQSESEPTLTDGR